MPQDVWDAAREAAKKYVAQYPEISENLKFLFEELYKEAYVNGYSKSQQDKNQYHGRAI